MRQLRRIVCVTLPVAVILTGCYELLRSLHNQRMENNPAVVYRRYKRELHGYARQLEAGEVYREPDRGYAMPQFLPDHGARFVVRKGDCFVVVFGFLPTDSVPELWYSPKGFDPLPSELEELRQTSSYFRWVQLSPNWGACHWD